MRTTRTWPVSVSTSTSAKLAPCAPLPDRPGFHCPRTLSPAAGRAAQACFHVRLLPLPAIVPASNRTPSGSAPNSGATALAIATLAL